MAKKSKTVQTVSVDQTLEQIAQKHLHFTLESSGRDRLDFHEVSIWEIKAALLAAYEAGKSAK